MRNKRFPNYPDDADYNTNAPSYYDDLARKEKLIRLLAERIWGYEKVLDDTLEEIQERFRAWDKNLEDLPEDLKILLQNWLDDGTLDHIINETIFNWKLDTTIFEQFRDSITAHFEQIHVNVKEFGAIGDGITDDFQAIQSAIDFVYANSLTGGIVYFPSGIYAISQPLNTFNGVAVNENLESVGDNTQSVSNGFATHLILKGHSKDSTVIKTMGNHEVIKPTSPSGFKALYRFTCENLRFYGTGVNTSVNLYSQTGYPRDVVFKNCDFNNFYTGFEFNRYKRESDTGGIHIALTFELCNFGLNQYGVDVNPDDTDFIKCRFERNALYGIHVSGGNRIGFSKCKIQYNGLGTLALSGGQVKLSGRITNLTFDDCYIENKSATIENNVGSTIFYVTPSDFDDGRTYLYNFNVTNSYVNTFRSETLMYVADGVMALRGLNFDGCAIRNIKPNPTTKELIRLPTTVYCYGLIFNSFLETIYNENNVNIEGTSEWVLSTSSRIMRNNAYMYKYVPHLPIENALGGSVSITAGSVSTTATQIYFNGNFTASLVETGRYLITLPKDNVTTSGGNQSFFPVVASAALSGYHVEVISKTPNTFELVVSNSSGTRANSSFSFIAIQTVK